MLIELQCSHKSCLRCCAETGPQDNFRVNCATCNTSQQIRHQRDVILLENFQQENPQRLPLLKCRAHNEDAVKFCCLHQTLLCNDCLDDHPHIQHWKPGTNKYVYSLLEKEVEHLLASKVIIETKVQQIRNLMKSSKI